MLDNKFQEIYLLIGKISFGIEKYKHKIVVLERNCPHNKNIKCDICGFYLETRCLKEGEMRTLIVSAGGFESVRRKLLPNKIFAILVDKLIIQLGQLYEIVHKDQEQYYKETGSEKDKTTLTIRKTFDKKSEYLKDLQKYFGKNCIYDYQSALLFFSTTLNMIFHDPGKTERIQEQLKALYNLATNEIDKILGEK